MTKLALAILVFSLSACANIRETALPRADKPNSGDSAAAPPTSAWSPPKTRPGADNWELYVDAPTLTPAKAAAVRPGMDTPEGALMAFYAAKMRGGEDWRHSLPAPGATGFSSDQADHLRRKLEESRDWTYLEVRLVGKVTVGEELYVQVCLKVQVGGKVEDGNDEATLMQAGGRWYVVAIPT